MNDYQDESIGKTMSEEIKDSITFPVGKKPAPKRYDRRIVLLVSILAFGVLVFLDQWTKNLTDLYLHNKESIHLIDNVLSLTYVENRGSAFGMMQGQFILFYIITALLLAVVVFVFIKTPCTKRYIPIFSVLIILTSGAIGNCIDRVLRGYVIDMIYFEPIDFPVFNVADIYVTIACVLLVIFFFFVYDDEDMEVYSLRKKKEHQEPEIRL